MPARTSPHKSPPPSTNHAWSPRVSPIPQEHRQIDMRPLPLGDQHPDAPLGQGVRHPCDDSRVVTTRSGAVRVGERVRVRACDPGRRRRPGAVGCRAPMPHRQSRIVPPRGAGRTRMAIGPSASRCASRRAVALVIHCESPVRVAILPSKLIAAWAMTNGRPVVIHRLNASLSGSPQPPTARLDRVPARCNRRNPRPRWPGSGRWRPRRPVSPPPRDPSVQGGCVRTCSKARG